MKLMVSSYNNGGSVWNAEAEETALRSYNIVHQFNEPAECVITLADPTGTKVQKYNTDANDVYLGVGKITLEDPTGTDIFYGRIIKASADTENRTCILVCKDWLDQLDGEQITYEMREDLDGAGLRQSTVLSDYTDTHGNGIKPAHWTGAGSYIYDHSDILTVDAHNGQHLVFNTGMAGSHSWKTGPYQETVTPSAAPMNVDLFVGGGPDDISYLWAEDEEYHSLSDGADWVVDYDFHSFVPDSGFFDSISGARVHIQYGAADESNDISMELYNGATYDSLGRVIGDALGNRFEKTIEVPKHLLSTMFDADGDVTVRLNCAEATGGTIAVYYIHVEIDTITTGYNTILDIIDTDTYWIHVFTVNLTADATKIWDGIPYSVAKHIYEHFESATGPILGGDTVVELTCGAANVEDTTGVSTQQFIDRTRLEIAQALATEDQSVFWVTLGGATVTYKKTFGADTMQLTDGKVLRWQSLQDYTTMCNEATVYGARIGDYQISENVADATSQTKFLEARSKVVKNPGIVSAAHAKAVATALSAKETDVAQFVSCTIAGNTATAAHATTIKLGEIVEITSSELWPTAAKDYIVSRWAYDSVEHKTYLTMYPKVSTGMPTIDTLHNKENTMQQTIRRSATDIYIPDPVTHEVA